MVWAGTQRSNGGKSDWCAFSLSRKSANYKTTYKTETRIRFKNYESEYNQENALECSFISSTQTKINFERKIEMNIPN